MRSAKTLAAVEVARDVVLVEVTLAKIVNKTSSTTAPNTSSCPAGGWDRVRAQRGSQSVDREYPEHGEQDPQSCVSRVSRSPRKKKESVTMIAGSCW